MAAQVFLTELALVTTRMVELLYLVMGKGAIITLRALTVAVMMVVHLVVIFMVTHRLLVGCSALDMLVGIEIGSSSIFLVVVVDAYFFIVIVCIM